MTQETTINDGNEYSNLNYYLVNNENDTIIETSDTEIDTVSSIVSYTLGDKVENLTLENNYDIVNGLKVYGHYNRWNIDYNQGDNQYSQPNTCGLVSIENILIQAGKINNNSLYSGTIDLRENEIVKYANDNSLCLSDGTSYQNWINQILTYYGVPSTIYSKYFNGNISLDSIASYVKEGRGVILFVNPKRLYGNNSYTDGMAHDITIVGVVYDENDNLQGFYICDSDHNDSEPTYFTIEQLNNAYDYSESSSPSSDERYAIITNSPIKPTEININGTGNELDNEITGNDGNNVLTGNGGSDELQGGLGSDTLYGDYEESKYIVEAGDTLSEIAEKYGLTVGEILAVNPGITDPDLIYVGQEILLPGNDDILEGGTGDDRLEGGAGNDKYVYTSGDGSDVINDSDGVGRVSVDGYFLTKATETGSGTGIYYDGKHNYQIVGTSLVITDAATGGTDVNITIENFDKVNSNLGINLINYEDLPNFPPDPMTWPTDQDEDDGKDKDPNLPPPDPILVDLDGGGIQTTTLEDGVYFDYSQDGFAELSSWVGEDDGILAIDTDSNGQIDDGSYVDNVIDINFRYLKKAA